LSCSNNAIEAVDKAIKECRFMKERVPFEVFKTRVLIVLEKYSALSRVKKLTPTYDLEIERKAFDWIKSEKKCRTFNEPANAKIFVFLPEQEKKIVSIHDIDTFHNPKYTSFDTFSQDIGNVHRVEVTDANWRAWNCTCYMFFKTNRCHHIVVAAVFRNQNKLQPEANTALLSVKRKPGRPK
jgi:hypothetical protein